MSKRREKPENAVFKVNETAGRGATGCFEGSINN